MIIENRYTKNAPLLRWGIRRCCLSGGYGCGLQALYAAIIDQIQMMKYIGILKISPTIVEPRAMMITLKIINITPLPLSPA